jgi:hypothetical protein
MRPVTPRQRPQTTLTNGERGQIDGFFRSLLRKEKEEEERELRLDRKSLSAKLEERRREEEKRLRLDRKSLSAKLSS